MSDVLVLDRPQTDAALDPQRLLSAVTEALVAVSRGTVSAPARIAALAPAGLLGAMPAHVPGLGLAAKLVSVFESPDSPGRSRHHGIVVLFDESTGEPTALMDAHAITARRTAAVATLSMQALAPDASRIAVVGTGVQAQAQLDLLSALDHPADVVVAGRTPGVAAELASTHPRARADTIEAAVRSADVVFCCTGATQPVVERAWLRDGCHVSSVGGSAGPELDPATIADAVVYAEWPGAASAAPPAGAHELQGYPAERLRLLGDVLGGGAVDRQAELTVFKSTGHAAFDVAAASVALEGARRLGLGVSVAI